MSTPRPAAALGDELSNLGIGLLIAAAILAGILRGAGTVAAWITGTEQPADGVEAGLRVLLNPGDPAIALGARGPERGGILDHRRRADPHRGRARLVGVAVVPRPRTAGEGRPLPDPGIATRTEVARAASDTVLLRRGGHLRPSLDKPKPRISDTGSVLHAGMVCGRPSKTRSC